MNMQIACLLVVLLTNVIIGTGIILSFLYLKTNLERDWDLKEKMFMFSIPINDEENLTIIDRLIQQELEVYQIYNFPKYADDTYITESDQKKMIKEILSNVLRKLSPVYRSKLIYIYNEQVLEDIIFGKVRDAVLAFTVEINGQFKDQIKK